MPQPPPPQQLVRPMVRINLSQEDQQAMIESKKTKELVLKTLRELRY